MKNIKEIYICTSKQKYIHCGDKQGGITMRITIILTLENVIKFYILSATRFYFHLK